MGSGPRILVLVLSIFIFKPTQRWYCLKMSSRWHREVLSFTKQVGLNFQKPLPFIWSFPILRVSFRRLWSDWTPGNMLTFSIKLSKWLEQKINQVEITCCPGAKWRTSCLDWQFARYPLGYILLDTRLYLLGSSDNRDALTYYQVYLV